MKKELFLAIASTFLTLVVAIALLRYFAPGLLGIAPDLQLVRVAREVPPFFESVFSSGEATDTDFLLRDPLTVNRGRPLYPDQVFVGLHDVLGFRNRHVPATADVVTIGDSQTYGNNAPIDLNWPGQLAEVLSDQAAVVYNMSVGGWEAPQYLYIVEKALSLSPGVLVVAFYSGNDPLGSFIQAYGAEHWEDLRPDPSLSKDDAPPGHWPPQPSEMWPVRFRDGTVTVFTPQLRLSSNLPDHPAVRAGWMVMEEVARRIDEIAEQAGVSVVFTVIPTKELVYAPRIERDRLTPPDAYRALVSSEAQSIRDLASRIEALENSRYVDVLGPLQRAAMSRLLYPSDANGHPLPPGYEIIADAVAPVIAAGLAPRPSGLMFLRVGQQTVPLLGVQGKLWIFDSMERVVANGWDIRRGRWIDSRQIAALRYAGTISAVDPMHYGPAAVESPDG